MVMSSNLSRCAKVISHYAFITVSSLSKKNIFQKCYFGEVAKMQERQIRTYVESLLHLLDIFPYIYRLVLLQNSDIVFKKWCLPLSLYKYSIQSLVVITGMFPGLHLNKCL